jgi:thiol-disulfide isomerase/thioredoxin
LIILQPWCHHCQRFSPVLDDLASNFTSTVKIAKIDATKSKELAATHEITSFPTIKFFRDGKYGYYSGERKYADLATFVSKIHGLSLSHRLPSHRLSDASVKTVYSQTELDSYLKDMNFAFVLSIDPSLKDSSEIHRYFVELANDHKMQANFVLHERPGPLLLQKMEINRNPFTLQVESNELVVEKREIEKFIEHHNHLLVTPLDKSNMRRLGRTGKPLIIAIIQENQNSSNTLLSLLEEAVSSLEIEIAHQFVVGFMNGEKYATYLERYRGALSPPSLLVIDLSVNGYYVSRKITKDSVQDTVTNAISKSLPWVEVDPVGLGLIEKARWKFNQYYPWSLLCCLPLLFFLLSFLFPHPSSIKQKAS